MFAFISKLLSFKCIYVSSLIYPMLHFKAIFKRIFSENEGVLKHKKKNMYYSQFVAYCMNME
jgi:hypothetical protein